MRVKKRAQILLVWVMVCLMLVSNGITAWAVTLTDTEINTEIQTDAETQTESENQTETETQSETVSESESESPSESPSEPDMEPDSRPSETDQAVPQEQESTKKEMNRRTSRSGGNNRTGDFKLNEDILKVYHGQDLVYQSGQNNQPVDMNMAFSPRLEFEIALSQINDKSNFQEGDYIQFELYQLKITGAGVIGDVSQPLSLTQNGVTLGTGQLVIDKDEMTGIHTISYKIVFSDQIVDKNSVSGNASGSFYLRDLETGSKVEIDKDGTEIFEINKIDPGDIPGPVYPAPNPETKKYAYTHNASTDMIDWVISMDEYTKKQFEDFESNAATVYGDIVIEDELDEYQTFFGVEPGNIQTVSALFGGAMYIYDPEDFDNESNTLSRVYPSWINYQGWQLADSSLTAQRGMQFIDPGTSVQTQAAARQLVKSTARTWTVYKSVDPADNGKEKLIFNFGAPGTPSGYTYKEVMGEAEFDRFLKYYKDGYTNAESVLSTNPGTDPDDIISDSVTGKTASRAAWQVAARAFKAGHEFYKSNPPFYSFYITVRTKLNRQKAVEDGVTFTENSYRITGDFGEKEGSGKLDGYWSGSLNAEAVKGEVQIFKADALYDNPDTKNDAEPVKGFMKDIEFEVYTSGDVKQKFKFESGKFVQDDNGDLETIKTNGVNGSAVISGLLPGDYYLKEVTAPDGYYTGQNQRINFTVNKDEVVYKIAKNQPRGLQLKKVDGEDQRPLAGAVFKLYKFKSGQQGPADEMTGFTKMDIDGTEYYVHDGSGDDELVSGADGMLRIVQLKSGNYYLQESAAPQGYILDNTPHKFTMAEQVPDKGTPIIDYGDIQNSPYKASGAIQFAAAKKLTGREFQEGDAFTFELYEDRGQGYGNIPIQSKTTTAVSGSSEVISFDPIAYTLVDKDQTYQYKIVEKQESAGGIEYDETVYEARYEITDQQTDELKITKVSGDDLTDAGTISFTNRYSAKGSLELTARKQWAEGVGIELGQGEFSFTVKEGDRSAATGSNRADGTIIFTPITYRKDTRQDDTGEHVYTVTEDRDEKAGIIYDASSYEVTVRVSDNLDGSLQAEVTGIKLAGAVKEAMVFTNDTTKVSILKTDEAGKALAGAELAVYDEAGKLVEAWTSTAEAHLFEGVLTAGASYTLRESNAPQGYLLAAGVPFTVPTEAKEIVVNMEDKKQDPAYQIEVSKYLRKDGRDVSMTYSFYAALFWDEACTERATEVIELKLENSYAAKAVFKNLSAGTYYAAETDAAGNAVQGNAEGWFTNEISKKEIRLTPQQKADKVSIINHITGNPPGDYSQDASIEINKEVVAGSKAAAVNDTFYFSLYRDAELTDLVVTQDLKLENQSAGTVQITGLAYGTYYLAESDADGVPVDESYKYGVKVEQDKVVLTPEAKQVTVQIINRLGEKDQTETETESYSTEKPSETETQKTTKKATPTAPGGWTKRPTVSKTRTSRAAKTGDNTQILWYLIGLAAASALIAGVVISRKKKERKGK